MIYEVSRIMYTVSRTIYAPDRVTGKTGAAKQAV